MPTKGTAGPTRAPSGSERAIAPAGAPTPLEQALANARPKRTTQPRVRAAGTRSDLAPVDVGGMLAAPTAPAAPAALAALAAPAAPAEDAFGWARDSDEFAPNGHSDEHSADFDDAHVGLRDGGVALGGPAYGGPAYGGPAYPRTAERIEQIDRFDNAMPLGLDDQSELLEMIDSIPLLPVHGPSAAPVAVPRVAETATVDTWLFVAVLGLLVIGTVEIFASTALSAKVGGGYFLTRQLMWVGIGGAGLWFASNLDLRWLRRAVYPLLFLAIAALFAVLVMPRINGAKRWFLLGPLSFQPVEIAKLALIVYLAHSIARKASKIKTFTIGFVPHLIVASIMMGALLMQPDLGSSVVIGATTLGMLFIAGARISYIMMAVLVALPVGYQLIVGTSWRMQRFLAYFNPEAFSDSEAYQFLQARLAIGSGGLTGVGLGNGRQSLGYMPEAHNDFILAPIGEELGFLGIAAVFALFTIIIWRGTKIALAAKDVFSSYLAFGITMLFSVQALFNAAVVLGLLPNKGITLPFVSYGGSSLLATMVLAGILINVGRRRDVAVAPARVANRAFARRKPQRVRVLVY